MHKQRIGVLVGAGIGVLGVFLPWVSSPIMSVSGITIGGWAYIALVAYLACLLFGFMGDKNGVLNAGGRIGALLSGLGGSAVGVYSLIRLGDAIGGRGAGLVGAGFGLYMCIAGGIIVLVVLFTQK